MAAAVARSRGLSLSRARTSHIDDVLHGNDLVVAVCDNAHEELGPQAEDRLHWSIPDPARVGTDDAFEQAFTDIADRIARLAPAVHSGDESDD
jgi:protein-tyrosine-phosphatase